MLLVFSSSNVLPCLIGIAVSSEKNHFTATKRPFHQPASKTAIAGRLFALTTTPQTDIMVFGFGGNGICRLGDVKGFLLCGGLRNNLGGKARSGY
jgi:hypothetical protein